LGTRVAFLTSISVFSVVRLRQDRSGAGLIAEAGPRGEYSHDRSLSFLELCLFGKGADVP
jgi:hypothetical protein